ncbi:MAG: lysophospholipid acyltransferase family protein [Planctomycetota bacterium]
MLALPKPPSLLLIDWFLTGLARLLSGPQVRWVDCQPDTCQRVYFANHTSHIDMVLVRTALPPACRAVTRPVAAADYWSKGWLRPHVAKAFNAMLIDRRKVKVHQSPVDLMLKEMGDSDSVIIFPEGGRSDGQRVGDFKSGLYYLGKKRPDLELVPVYLHNMHRVLPRDEYLPIPLLATVAFGSPIWLEQGESKADFLARARQAVLRLAPGDDD